MSPDLICTYRNLHHPARDYPYSLGVHVDVMTQATDAPVLLLPHPESSAFQSLDGQAIRSVMAITDRLTGDHRLVNYARLFAPRDGTLWLTHMEDEATWERYLLVLHTKDEDQLAMHGLAYRLTVELREIPLLLL